MLRYALFGLFSLMRLNIRRSLLFYRFDEFIHPGVCELRAVLFNGGVHVVHKAYIDRRAILLHHLVDRGQLGLYVRIIDYDCSVPVADADLLERLLELSGTGPGIHIVPVHVIYAHEPRNAAAVVAHIVRLSGGGSDQAAVLSQVIMVALDTVHPQVIQVSVSLDRFNKGKGEYFAKRDALIAEYKAAGRRNEIESALKALHWESREATIPEDLCFVYGEYLDDYLHDVEICQRFARRSRERMAEIILERLGIEAVDAFHTIHNYIDVDEMILRKGAIAAHKGERVLIPINMRDGSILATGKGNEDWNYSAPHGAGRLMSRTVAKERLDMDEYRREMAGVYTTSVNEATLDEAPMAYKSLADIVDVVSESVDIIEVLKPIYNFKAN